MSTSLHWQLLPRKPKENYIGSLKWVMQEEGIIQSGDGAVTVGVELIPFLKGIIAGAGTGNMSNDANKLIDAISRYGQVQLVIS